MSRPASAGHATSVTSTASGGRTTTMRPTSTTLVAVTVRASEMAAPGRPDRRMVTPPKTSPTPKNMAAATANNTGIKGCYDPTSRRVGWA